MGFVPVGENSFGRHEKARYMSKKERKARYRHPILLYEPNIKREDLPKLTQVLNVYEHTEFDFEFNMRRIIKCIRMNIGSSDRAFFTIGQRILFRTVPDGEPMILPLIQFGFNYTLMMIYVLLGESLEGWTPWVPTYFSNSAILQAYDDAIYACRGNHTHREICDVLAEVKYWLNVMCDKVGDHLGYSISNNEFVEVAKRDPEVMKSITCTFDIPKNSSPGDLEKLRAQRTRDMLKSMSKQDDLCLSTYARTGLLNAGQLAELAVHIGYKPDLIGNTIPMTAPTNVLMGINDPRAHMVDARGGRKAEVLKKRVSDAGTFERSISIMMSKIRYVDMDPDHECNSKHYRTKKIQSQDDLANLDGRVATLDPDSDEFFIIDPRNDRFQLIGKTIYLKTPITCSHKLRHKGVICSACYGKLLSAINQDVHLGRLSGLNDADEMEQKLLSAKHALKTETTDVDFTDNFNTYFALETCAIHFNESVVTDYQENPENYSSLYLEFNPGAVKKMKDGEGRHFDYQFSGIIIYDAISDTREIIRDLNKIKIFMSPMLAEYYAPEADKKAYDVRIPLSELIETFSSSEILFEYEYKNFELSDPLTELNGILNNGTDKVGINKYKSYDECLDDLMPKFEKGGIHVPDIHIEMLIACTVFSPDDGEVDWSIDDPEYKFCSIEKSIMNSPSVITSLLYTKTNPQLDGAYNTYQKSGTSGYDSFIGGE